MNDSPDEIIARSDTLKGARMNFESYWGEVSDFIFPGRSFNREWSPGSRRQQRIFNTMPILANEQLAGGLHGMLTSPQLRWFALRCSDPRWKDDEAAQLWFDAATERMYSHFSSPVAGFATSAHEVYMDISAFGTGVMYVQDRGSKGPLYRSVALQESFIAEGEDGRIDTIYRCYPMSARNVVATWPETCGKDARELAEKRPDQMLDLIHAVAPTTDGRGWWSKYILKSKKIELEKGRFRSFPFVVPRWTKRSGEVYGTGAGMNALPDVKLLNKVEETTLRGAMKMVDPPIMVPDDGFLSPISTKPNSVNLFRAGMMGENDRAYAFETKGRPDIGVDQIKLYQDRVEGIFYTRWMNLPSQPNMTATEVIQRRDEMLRLLGPMTARLQNEMLGPVIERTFDCMFRGGMFPPLPAEMAGAEWTVEYVSPLAISQQTQDADAIIRTMAVIGQFAQFDPTVMNAVDAPQAARLVAGIYHAPPSMLRSKAEADQIAQQQQQAQAQQQEMMAAQAAAQTAKSGAGAVKDLAAAGQTTQAAA